MVFPVNEKAAGWPQHAGIIVSLNADTIKTGQEKLHYACVLIMSPIFSPRLMM